jgi:hypothetical protein
MRNSTLFFALLLITSIYACQQEAVVDPTCIEEKIAEWQENNYPGSAVYKLEGPSVNAWLFVAGCVDCGDYYYDETCRTICATNIEGVDPGVVQCGQEFADATKTVIWEAQ